MAYRVPTTAQAERIHRAFDEARAERPLQAELLREMEGVIVQQPDDSSPDFPEPVEVLVKGVVRMLPEPGTVDEQTLLELVRGNHD